jgi:hypothetical protein
MSREETMSESAVSEKILKSLPEAFEALYDGPSTDLLLTTETHSNQSMCDLEDDFTIRESLLSGGTPSEADEMDVTIRELHLSDTVSDENSHQKESDVPMRESQISETHSHADVDHHCLGEQDFQLMYNNLMSDKEAASQLPNASVQFLK